MSTEVFNEYAAYYNLLYKDKDYSKECEYIHKLVREYAPQAKTILNLGCGTGNHDFILSEKGYSITGVDFSAQMISIASERLQKENTKNPDFLCADIRELRLEKKFDVVISLFHVMSYQVTNTDILNAFKTAREHLSGNGIFIFDFWYGPAVLTSRPEERTKLLEDEKIKVVREANPVMHPNENIVDVNYAFQINEKATGKMFKNKEQHRMRYFFMPELKAYLAQTGFKIIKFQEWLTSGELSFDTWNGIIICKPE